jgi:hypothetical protein
MDHSDLEKVMNAYGADGYRVSKAEFIGDIIAGGMPMKKFAVYLEKKIKKSKNV